MTRYLIHSTLIYLDQFEVISPIIHTPTLSTIKGIKKKIKSISLEFSSGTPKKEVGSTIVGCDFIR